MAYRVTEAQKEAAAKRRAAIRQLSKRIAAMTVDQQLALTKGNIATIDGHALSPHNQILVACQGCQSAVVGGFNQWRKAGRAVRKGVHGYAIWIPCGAKKLESDSPDGDNDIYFSLATVFGIDQTEPIPAAE